MYVWSIEMVEDALTSKLGRVSLVSSMVALRALSGATLLCGLDTCLSLRQSQRWLQCNTEYNLVHKHN